MAKEQLNLLIDPELKREFKEAAKLEIGDLHGAMSLAASQALRDWINKHKHA